MLVNKDDPLSVDMNTPFLDAAWPFRDVHMKYFMEQSAYLILESFAKFTLLFTAK